MVVLPNQPPTVTITGGPTGNTTDTTPTFTYLGTDTDGTISGYYVAIDDGTPNNWTVSTSYTPASALPRLSATSQSVQAFLAIIIT